METTKCDNTMSVDNLRESIIAVNKECEYFLKVSEIHTVPNVSYSFYVYDLKGNSLLFVVYYF